MLACDKMRCCRHSCGKQAKYHVNNELLCSNHCEMRHRNHTHRIHTRHGLNSPYSPSDCDSSFGDDVSQVSGFTAISVGMMLAERSTHTIPCKMMVDCATDVSISIADKECQTDTPITIPQDHRQSPTVVKTTTKLFLFIACAIVVVVISRGNQ